MTDRDHIPKHFKLLLNHALDAFQIRGKINLGFVPVLAAWRTIGGSLRRIRVFLGLLFPIALDDQSHAPQINFR